MCGDVTARMWHDLSVVACERELGTSNVDYYCGTHVYLSSLLIIIIIFAAKVLSLIYLKQQSLP